MALGFGFNKAKVLAAAEKYVQQGKLQNAITEYEKVVKEDPKDLTVLNTIGDLSARIGNNDQAAHYFKKVGDTYASDGFTVKAIAMYKKLTKLTPGQGECILRLAELYTIQGLYNDARQQYVAVADQFLKGGNNEDAAKVFQKILELDPENTAMQQKLADLYMRLGKKNEAREIYFTAAQSLYAKQAMDAADEALGKVLQLDPKNVDALVLRGTIASESGDPAGTIKYLDGIADIDSRPDALRALLRAQVQQGNFAAGEPLANKLITVHNDLSGVTIFADAAITAQQFATGLAMYEQHADKMLAANSAGLLKSLNACIAKVKEDAKALESLRTLLTKAGDVSHKAELTELLAHAYVQENQLEKARDLYKELAESEPENPLHAQNYKQVIAKLGEDPAARELSPEEGMQAFMVDELQHEAPVITPDYPPDTLAAIRHAITDSELFASYNLPAKAIAPLEMVLTKAPSDPQLNQHLASLYAKAQRFADAAKCCTILQQVYGEHGHEEQAKQYGDMAAKYEQQALVTPPPRLEPAAVMEEPAASYSMEAPATSFVMDVAAPAAGDSSVAEFSFETAPPVVNEFATTPQSEAAEVSEFSVSSAEPFSASSIPEEAAPAPAAHAGSAAAHDVDLSEWESMMVEEPPAAAAPPIPPAPAPVDVDALVEEAKFYIVQSMWDAADASVARIKSADPQHAAIAELKAQIKAGRAPAPAPEPVAPPPQPEPAAAEASVAEFSFEVPAPEPAAPAPPAAQVAPPPPAPRPAPTIQAAPLPPSPAPIAQPAAAAAAAPAPAMEADDLLGDLVSDLDESLGEGFSFGGSAPAPAKAAHASTPPPAPAPMAAPAAAASAAAAAAPAPVAAAKAEETSVLSDMFAEFKEDVEETAGQAEDPDTHYNLGIAFKEMGLLDEAIGELQKVCHAVDAGHPFTQAIQAYTWLAQCLVDKGVPQAAIKWYEKALKMPGMNEESRLAVYYDMGSAQEMAGNSKAAYNTFMEVYSSNIDYRDVADRVRALKQ